MSASQDTVEGGGCTKGCGADLSGTVTQCNGCKKLKVGDKVWGASFGGAYGEYAVAPESDVGIRPTTIDTHAAATIPEVGLTSWMSLKVRAPMRVRHLRCCLGPLSSGSALFRSL